MSASLVGSEMCIRDRLCTADHRSCCNASRSLEAGPSHLGGRLRAERIPCLLYTSDAADDM
eukprot:13365039-Alexandrium_andersonii.AAC.1